MSSYAALVMDMKSHYTEVDGINYLKGTPEEVIKILGGNIGTIRLRLDLGNSITGESWSIDEDSEGYIMASTGEIPVPLIVPTLRSSGGTPIRTNCIVSIWTSKGDRLYKHPKYTPKFSWIHAMVRRSEDEQLGSAPWKVMVLPWSLRDSPPDTIDGRIQNPANFGTEGQAIRWLNKKKRFERV